MRSCGGDHDMLVPPHRRQQRHCVLRCHVPLVQEQNQRQACLRVHVVRYERQQRSVLPSVGEAAPLLLVQE